MKFKETTKKDTYVEDVNEGRDAILQAIARRVEDESGDDYERQPLCIDTTLTKNIVLSTGGPADGFKLTFTVYEDGEKELSSGVYYRADWGAYREAELTNDEAQEVFEFYMGGEIL